MSKETIVVNGVKKDVEQTFGKAPEGAPIVRASAFSMSQGIPDPVLEEQSSIPGVKGAKPKQLPWVWNGQKNQTMRDMVNTTLRSVTLKRCLNHIVKHTYGMGLVELDDKGNPKDDSAMVKKIGDILSGKELKKIIEDRVFTGHGAAKILYEGVGRRRRGNMIKYMPSPTLAPGKIPKTKEEIEKYFFNMRWEDWTVNDPLPKSFPAFKFGKKAVATAKGNFDSTVEIAVCKPHTPMHPYWSAVEHGPGLYWAEVEIGTAAYKRRLQNKNFAPTMHIDIKMDLESEDQRQYVNEEIRNEFTGPDASDIFITYSPLDGSETNVTPIAHNYNTDYWKWLLVECERQIFQACGVDGKLLGGRGAEGEGGLGNNAKEIEVKDDYFHTSVIVPLQDELAEWVKDILKEAFQIDVPALGFGRLPALDYEKYDEKEVEQAGAMHKVTANDADVKNNNPNNKKNG